MQTRTCASSCAALLAAIIVFAVAMPAAASPLYVQPWDGTGNAFASQNDPNNFGLFVFTLDNFTLAQDSYVNSIAFVGLYFNPAQWAPISQWEVGIYNSSLSLIYDQVIAGNGNETFLQNTAGFPTYSYSFGIPQITLHGGQEYWVTVVPTVGFPPQWGWATSSTGDGQAIQCFFGSCGAISSDLAFSIGGSPTPEPGSLMLLGSGIVGLAAYARKKLL